MAQFNFADLGCDEKGDSIDFKINYEIFKRTSWDSSV